MALSAHSPHRPTTPATASTPTSSELDHFLYQLSLEFSIPYLNRPRHGWAPKSGSKTDGDVCCSLIRFLFYKNRHGLHRCLEEFRQISTEGRTPAKLKSLLNVEKPRITTPSRASSSSHPTSLHNSFTSESTSANTSFDTIFSHQALSAATSATTSGSLSAAHNTARLQHSPSSFDRMPIPPQSPSPHSKLSQRRIDDWYKVSKPGLSSGDAGSRRHSASDLVTKKSISKRVADDVAPARNTDNVPGKNQLNHETSESIAVNDVCKSTALSKEAPFLSRLRGRAEPHEHSNEANGRLDCDSGKASKEVEHWQLKILPDQGFFQQDLPESFDDLPIRVRYECLRYANYHRIVLPCANELFPNGFDSLKEVCNQLSQLGNKPTDQSFYEPLNESIWKASMERGWRNELSLGGTIHFQTSKDSSALRLKLNPIRQLKSSNRFYRKYGSHRFLRLTVPSHKNSPRHLGGKGRVSQRIREWLNTPGKKLLGCSWTAIFTKPGRATNKAVEKFGESEGRQVIFFAESGPGYETVKVDDLLDWFLPIHLNKQMPACKAYSRLELGFSPTTPTLVFKPNQIYEVPDILGNGALEDPTLNDPCLDWLFIQNQTDARIMNDGCEMISAAAARLVWDALNEPGAVPSAFQARMGPWKGVWFVASGPHQGPISHEDIWIRVNSTQKKFERHVDDRAEFTFDELRLSFDVVQWSRKPSRSAFYHEYLPILEDRGVTRESCRCVVQDWLEAEKVAALKAMSHSMQALEWMQSRKAVLACDPKGTEWSGERRKTKSQMAQTLIQNGFDVKTCHYLAKLVVSTIKDYLTDISNDLRISIPHSTSLIGIADPWGVLAPNEISVVFSDSKLAGSPFLCDIDVLVSRHPALRASDIQRVRAVCKPELSYLVDVVVFPVTGSYPLASKLQGGDYDGDTFWLCWDLRIVHGFRNAPPPTTSPRPEKYNIRVDRTNCEEFLEGENFTRRFLAHNFEFQLQDSLLGICTNLHKRVRYTWNNIRDEGVQQLADIHDLLVDSSKNGYLLSADDWSNWKNQNTSFRAIREPLYEQAPGMRLEDDDRRGKWSSSTDITDYLIFDVARAGCRSMIQNDLEKTKMTTNMWDADLGKLWTTVKIELDGVPEVLATLRDLKSKLSKTSYFYEPWQEAISRTKILDHDPFATEEMKFSMWKFARQECRKRFQRIKPLFPDHLASKILTLKDAEYATSTWERIKASALFHEFFEQAPFAFAMAGDTLCDIKARTRPGSELTIAPIWQRSKLRKRKITEVDFDVVETATEEEVMTDDEEDFVTVGEGSEVAADQDQTMLLLNTPIQAPVVDDEDMAAPMNLPVVPDDEPMGSTLSTQYDTALTELTGLSQVSEGCSQLSVT